MKRVGEWFRSRREGLRLRQQDLSASSGVSVATIRALETGLRPVNRSTIRALARALKADPDRVEQWATGQLTEEEFNAGVGRSAVEFLKQNGLHPTAEGLKLKPHLPSLEFIIRQAGEGTPVLGEITAGGMVESIVFDPGDEPERVPISYPGRDRVYGLRIRGDSMAPEYRPGEILIVQDATIEELSDGEDAVIQCNGSRDGQSTFKRCHFTGGGKLKLSPLNPAYPSAECPLDHIIRIGKVLGVYRPVGRKKTGGGL